jgi:DeoR/GlpR family transcriptional regulator of sugar metabolism
MLVEERRNYIRRKLITHGSVRVGELVQELEVSEETIRRDLQQLEADGLVKKNYGGAILVRSVDAFPVPPVTQRQSLYRDEKEAIGRAAARLAEEGQIIILDAGTTMLSVATHLRSVDNLTIVTNGINVADECSLNQTSTVYVAGGKLVKNSMSLIGPQTKSELLHYDAHFAFLGTSGVSLRKGFTSSDLYEAEVKRTMVAAADKVVIVADHSKFGRQGLLSFATFEEVDYLITSDRVDEKELKEIEKVGVNLIVCALDHTG